MKIGIIGVGFVGSAIKNGLENNGYTDIFMYDPKKFPNSNLLDVVCTDLVFVCVPTPMSGSGEIDISILESVINDLSVVNYVGIVVIKSTVIPTKVKYLIDKYKNLKFVTDPEFLTERTANSDFMNNNWVILGGNVCYMSDLIKLYNDIKPGCNISILSCEGAMMVKYMTNVLFATKVTLMNEFFDLWSKLKDGGLEGEWGDIVNAFKTDFRVGTEHLQVPGHDGYYGFGGKCFPKDLRALIYLAKEMDSGNMLMNSAWEENKRYRKNKNWLTIDGATTESYIESNEYILWYIKMDRFKEYEAAAKCRQFSDWVSKYNPFGKRNVVIIPSDENKLCIFNGDMSELSADNINLIKNKIKEIGVIINLDK